MHSAAPATALALKARRLVSTANEANTIITAARHTDGASPVNSANNITPAAQQATRVRSRPPRSSGISSHATSIATMPTCNPLKATTCDKPAADIACRISGVMSLP